MLFFYKHGGLTCTQIQGPLRCCVCEVLNIHLRIDALTWCRYSNADTIKSDTILKELTLLNDQCAYFLQIQIQLHIPCWYIVNADTRLVKIRRSRGVFFFFKAWWAYLCADTRPTQMLLLWSTYFPFKNWCAYMMQVQQCRYYEIRYYT